ncbi:hypothetical protein EDB81DRAFT_650355 [Dactylonectria macrodidyma]|uniref:Succinate dehydrogenase assembly factor 4, mitochondrial n=1 Tax=Dactylonectria macrodidyma TaxID=307937 RepID=A0A9P9J510_9HYPO|nr:hypothetical protein EDB81DRAFT_650355 [Dactylonectria macrodidyma]
MSRLLTPTVRALLRPRTATLLRQSSSFRARPAPPKLPADQQAEFERLQRAASPAEPADVNQGLFRGAPPEFEGDVNPKTGEVGGPKNEPLRWGDKGDWSYNGRVTDF